MNIKRGLIRLWLVLSILFAGLVFFISWDRLKVEFDKAALMAAIPKTHDTLLPMGCWEKRGAATVDYTTNHPDGSCAPWENVWYTVPKLRQLYPEYANPFPNDFDLIEKAYLDAKIPTHPVHEWAMLRDTALVALGFPALTIIIGGAFIWAFSGFGRQKTS